MRSRESGCGIFHRFFQRQAMVSGPYDQLQVEVLNHAQQPPGTNVVEIAPLKTRECRDAHA